MARSVERVLDVLVAVSSASAPVGLAELSESVGLDKATTSRYAQDLVDRGFLVRSASTKCYSVGPSFVSMAFSYSSRLSLVTAAEPYLDALRDRTGETVSLHFCAGTRRVCIAGRESTQSVRRVLTLGESVPLYLGPSGKVILARLRPGSKLDDVLNEARNDPRVDMAKLGEQLRSIRRSRYALTCDDRTPGVGALSFPILSGPRPVASLTVAGPSSRWTEDAARSFVSDIGAAADAISEKVTGPGK